MQLAPLADGTLAAWVAALHSPTGGFDVAEARRHGTARALARPREPSLERVTDHLAADHGPRVRVYEPANALEPVVVYLHGGMWVLGDLETHDRTCRRLAAATAARVVAVDFRRGPEHRWPAAVDDALAAIAWVCAELGAERPLLAGDSSGGHLALLAALRMRDLGERCGGLLLACPNADLRLRGGSVAELGHGWGLEVDSLRWAIAQWLPEDVSADDPAVSPVLADLTGIAPAAIVTADHDPLRDEGAALAEALTRASVPVSHRCEPGMVHGFVQNLDLVSPACARATERWLDDARALVARVPA